MGEPFDEALLWSPGDSDECDGCPCSDCIDCINATYHDSLDCGTYDMCTGCGNDVDNCMCEGGPYDQDDYDDMPPGGDVGAENMAQHGAARVDSTSGAIGEGISE
jgi:hypothetical protein